MAAASYFRFAVILFGKNISASPCHAWVRNLQIQSEREREKEGEKVSKWFSKKLIHFHPANKQVGLEE